MSSKNDQPQKTPPNQHPEITIFADWCKSCGICVAFCPKEVLNMDENRQVFVQAPEKCIACHMCELRCPDFAINVEKAEPTTDSREEIK